MKASLADTGDIFGALGGDIEGLLDETMGVEKDKPAKSKRRKKAKSGATLAADDEL